MNSMLLIARNDNPFLLNIDVCRASDSDLDRWHTWDSSFHLDDIECDRRELYYSMALS